MAASNSKAIAMLVVVATVCSIIGAAVAADAPAPAPTSAVGSVSPSLTAGCIAAFAALILGSALRI